MTVLNAKDYNRFTWKNRKIILIFSIIVLGLRLLSSLFITNLIITYILTILSVIFFLLIIEILMLYNYQKSIISMDKNNGKK